MTCTIYIFTRRGSGDCYIARAQGLGITASCTSSPIQAAERCAMKVRLGRKDVTGLLFEDQDITINEIVSGAFGVAQYKAEWKEAA
jgi:hypothetical protein